MGSAENAIVFLETPLETVPEEIINHPSIIADAKRRGKHPSEILLDDSKHHAAMKKLENREKRGRPDILHYSILLFMDSPVKNDFEIFVHTVNNEIIRVDNSTRLPRNYNRFVGLMEDLFRKRVIRAGERKLLEITSLRLHDIFKNREVVILREKGELGESLLKSVMKTGNFVIGVGCFPHGDFSESTLDTLVSSGAKFVTLGTVPYTTLYVTSRIICIYERVRTSQDC